MIDGSTHKVDENYVRESILYPNAKVVAGYGPVSKMNSFDGKFSDQQINDIIWFMKYVKDPGKYASFDPAKEEAKQDEGGSVDGAKESAPAKAPTDEKQAPDATEPQATNQN